MLEETGILERRGRGCWRKGAMLEELGAGDGGL